MKVGKAGKSGNAIQCKDFSFQKILLQDIGQSQVQPGIVLKRLILCYIFFKDIKYDTERDFGKIWQLMASYGNL